MTRGVKNLCELNKLEHFHIFDNLNVDATHDFLEGLLPFTMKNVCSYCVDHKIFTMEEPNSKIRFFNFGQLGKDKRPSTVNIGKGNCNQSAIQNYFLMIHLPFILYKKMCENEKLAEIWEVLTSLLKIMQIVFSPTIKESDIQLLEKKIETHLKLTKKHFGKLIPKHHLVTHYPSTIRLMGPPLYTSMMRMESKHLDFTRISRSDTCYKNLLKTCATKHQENLARYQSSQIFLKDNIVMGKSKYVLNLKDFDSYHEVLKNSFKDLNNVCVIKRLMYNNSIFKPNLFLFLRYTFKRIDYVICCHDNKNIIFGFLCTNFNIVGTDTDLNSLEIKKEDDSMCELVLFNDLTIKKSYDAKYLDQKYFIIADTLELQILV